MKFDEALHLLMKDSATVLRRFSGSTALLERFVRKFPQDKSFEQLSEAVGRDDYQAIEVAAHTLKGLAGNLGFDGLFENANEMVVAVRQQAYDRIPGLFDAIKRDYESVLQIISQIDP